MKYMKGIEKMKNIETKITEYKKGRDIAISINKDKTLQELKKILQEYEKGIIQFWSKKKQKFVVIMSSYKSGYIAGLCALISKKELIK